MVRIDFTSAVDSSLKGIVQTGSSFLTTNGYAVSRIIVTNEGPSNIYFDTNTSESTTDVRSLVKPSATIDVKGEFATIETISLRSEGTALVQIIAII